MSEKAQKKFQGMVRKLGRLIRQKTEETFQQSESKIKKVGISTWLSAFVIVRWFSDTDGSFKAKFRVQLPDGSLHCLLDPTKEMKTLFREMWETRKEDELASWFGLRVEVTSDGDFRSELDNDPNCAINDPMWYSS